MTLLSQRVQLGEAGGSTAGILQAGDLPFCGVAHK